MPSAATDAPPAAPTPQRRWSLVVAVTATTAWLAALLALVVTTANPVTVNRSQLLAADAVVVADADLGSVRGPTVMIQVEKTLAGRILPRTLRIVSEDVDRIEEGKPYLFPLSATRDGYAVAPVPQLRIQAGPHGLVLTPIEDGDERTAVFYPATEDVLQAAERILTTEAVRPYP